MRWFKKDKPVNRIVKRFAWFPIRIGDEYRWLETVYMWQRLYKSYDSLTDICRYRYENNKFITKEDYIQLTTGEEVTG